MSAQVGATANSSAKAPMNARTRGSGAGAQENAKAPTKVSVIVPVYNNELYLGRCIESLLGQTLSDIEIICINDGSTDSSGALLHEYARKDKRIVVIDRENAGYGAAVNLGLQKATGDYVGILESDDFAELGMFERLYRAAVQNDLDAVRANYYFFWERPEERDELHEIFFPDECDRVEDSLSFSGRQCFFAPAALWSGIYKRSFIEDNKLKLLETPGAAYQDTSFNFKIWACARRIMFVHEPLVHYRRDNEASSINSPGKLYCICDEYAEIERWLDTQRPDLRAALNPIVNKMRYDAYVWNTERVSQELKPAFVQRMSEELRALDSRNMLDLSLFSEKKKKECALVMEDPWAFAKLKEEWDEGASTLARLSHKIQTGLYHLRRRGLREAVRLLRRD